MFVAHANSFLIPSAVGAAELLEESHRLFESIGDGQGRAMTLVHLGVIPLNRGEYARAEEYFERGLRWPGGRAIRLACSRRCTTWHWRRRVGDSTVGRAAIMHSS